MSSSKSVEQALPERSEEGTQPVQEVGYTAFTAQHELGFDPTKDLNLPSSYEEVNARFRRLQSGRVMEDLN